MNVNAIGLETVANWMILRGYAYSGGDTIQHLLFSIEEQAKGRGGPPEPPPGEGDFKLLQQRLADAEADALRLHAEKMKFFDALLEISTHWACQYDHPRKENEMYRGPYGIGVTDGHRACAAIANAALNIQHGGE
jgi:hypothetical protein